MKGEKLWILKFISMIIILRDVKNLSDVIGNNVFFFNNYNKEGKIIILVINERNNSWYFYKIFLKCFVVL